MIGEFVLIRSRSAGVHCGYLVECYGTNARLRESRNVWRWRGANTLNELALHGANMKAYTRISEPVADAAFGEVVEVLVCTPEAKKNLEVSRWLN